MKKKTVYKNAQEDLADAISTADAVDDFLPAPEFLVKKEDSIKITISLSRSSVDFFKEKAKKAGVPYQTMIRSVIDRYSSHYQKSK